MSEQQVKSGWKKPELECIICRSSIDLVAVRDADGWSFSWDEECPEGHINHYKLDYGLVGEHVWPFVGDFAHSSDFEKLGIVVEVV